MFLLAMLVRTKFGERIDTGRWMAERFQYTGDVNVAVDGLQRQPENADFPLQPDQWLLVAGESEPEPAIAVRYDGVVLTPGGPVDVASQLDAGGTVLEAALALDSWLSDSPAAMTPAPLQGDDAGGILVRRTLKTRTCATSPGATQAYVASARS